MIDLNCITCGIFTQLDDLSVRYGREVFDALAPSVRIAFSSFLGLWFAFQILVKGLFRGELTVQELLPKALLFILIDVLLRSSSYYWDFLYVPARETMNAVAQIVVVPSGGDITDNSVAGLLHTVEIQIRRVLHLGFAMIEDGGFTRLNLIAAGLILILPYLFVWCIFMAFMLEGVFKLLAVTALAPLAIAMAAFSATRGFAVASLRVVLNGMLTVVFAAVAMGFTVAVVRYYTTAAGVPLQSDGKIEIEAGKFIFRENYLAIFILGFVSILFHLKAATLASNISGASDGPGAAASVVGASMASLAWAKRTALAPVQRYSNKLWDKLDEGAGRGTNTIRDRLIDSFTKHTGAKS